jgi:hypothetical protein
MQVLELIAHDKSMQSPLAYKRERPYWDEIEKALKSVFEHGGFARLDVLRPENSYIRELCLDGLPNQFRISVLTLDDNPKNGYLEWWEPGESKFRGTIRIRDDAWDARTVCCELDVAQKYFHELFETGDLSHESLADFRSPWNPKPK